MTSHDAGATFVYHGHFVRLLWQSAHESVMIWSTVALWNSDVSKATTAKLKKRFGEQLFL